MRVLFVCLGNICRSPTAEAVMRDLTADAGLAEQITIDSAGTGDWHIGYPPDPRAVEAGSKRGLEVCGTARQVAPSDFENFDLIASQMAQSPWMARSQWRRTRAWGTMRGAVLAPLARCA